MRLFVLLLTLLFCGSPCAFAQAPAKLDAHSQARAQLREIVSRSEFNSATAAPNNALQDAVTWWRKKWDALMKWLGEIFSQTPKIISNALFVWVFIGLFLIFASRALIDVLRNRSRTPKLRNAPLAFAEDIEEFPSLQEWLDRAKACAQRGDYAKAYRAAFIALLIALDAEGVAPFKKHRTNGEYIALLAKSPPLHQALKPAFHQFDAHRYGSRPALPADYAETLALCERLPALVAQTGNGHALQEAAAP